VSRMKASEKEIIRLSFRKGGEKEMYKRLKSVLASKPWQTAGDGSVHVSILVCKGLWCFR
jgi:ESCRT-II complex subunit VPS36